MERRVRDRSSQRNKKPKAPAKGRNWEIDLVLAGFDNGGTSKRRDAFRCSSETKELGVYTERVQMVERLAKARQWELLRARLQKKFTTSQLAEAYIAGGVEGPQLAALLKEAQAHALATVRDQYRERKLRRLRERLGDRPVTSRNTHSLRHVDRFVDWMQQKTGKRTPTLDDFTADNVDEFLDSLTSLIHKKEAKEASGATRNRYRASLHHFGAYCVGRRLLMHQPVSEEFVEKRVESAPRVADLHPSEYAALFKALDAHCVEMRERGRGEERPELALMTRLLIHTGVDTGEAMQLRAGQAYLDQDHPFIRTQRAKTKRHTLPRNIPLPRPVADELKQHIVDNNLEFGDLLFPRITDNIMRTAWEKVRKALKRPDIRWKDLRHVAAVAWAKAGVDLLTIRDRLGHTTVKQTEIYATFIPDNDWHADATERAAARLMGLPSGRTAQPEPSPHAATQAA